MTPKMMMTASVFALALGAGAVQAQDEPAWPPMA